MALTTTVGGKPVTESTATTLVKAILFLACAEGFEWVLYRPIRVRIQPAIERALAPLFGEYAGWFAFAAFVDALFYLSLTALFIKCLEHKSLSAFGFRLGEREKQDFWNGLFLGFLPGMTIALGMIVTGLADASLSIASFLRGLITTPVHAFVMVLVASGYALQVLIPRFSPVLAIALVSVTSNVFTLGTLWSKGWEPILGLSLFGSVLVSALLGYAFCRRGTLWFPAGLYCGLLFAPTGGRLVYVSWANRVETPIALNFSFGIPHLLILLVCAFLLWKVSALGGVSETDNFIRDSSKKTLSKWFFLGSWTLGFGVALIAIMSVRVAVLRVTIWHEDRTFPTDVAELSKAALLPGLLALTVFCLLVYRMWAAIQDGHASVTPGRAVGFLFIPLFNIYWATKAIAGFADDYNMYVKRRSIAAHKLRYGLLLAYVVLVLADLVPFLNIVAGPAMYIVGMVLIAQVCNAVNSLGHGVADQSSHN